MKQGATVVVVRDRESASPTYTLRRIPNCKCGAVSKVELVFGPEKQVVDQGCWPCMERQRQDMLAGYRHTKAEPRWGVH
jgi:hypothetical protein